MKDIQNEIGDASLQPYPFTSKQMTWMGEWRILFDFTTDKDIEYTAALFENYPPDKKEYEFTFYPKGGNFKDIVNKGELFKVMSTIVAILKDGINQLNDRGGWNKIKFSPSKSFKGDERRANLYQSYIAKNLPSNIKVSGGTNKITFTNLNQSQLKEMKDIQKIKEFFSKPLEEGTTEYYKPTIRKDKSNPNFLYVDIAYPAGSDVLSVGGSETMGGQDRKTGAAKAMRIGQAIAAKLESTYNTEDIEVSDNKAGKVIVFAVSDDFIEMNTPSLDESLTAGYPYRKTSGEGFEKIIITEPIYGATKERMIRNFREEGWDAKPNFSGGITAVKKTLMNEANGFTSGKQMINIKLKNYPKAVAKVNQLINMIGESNFTMEMAEWIWDFFNNASFEQPVDEATKDEETEFHTKLDKLVHDTFGKRKDELEESRQVHPVVMQSMTKNASKKLKSSKLSSAEYQEVKKLKDFKASDWKYDSKEDLYTKVTEASDYMKRRQAQDDYAVSKKDKPKKSYNPTPSGKTDYMKRREKDLAEAILAKLKK